MTSLRSEDTLPTSGSPGPAWGAGLGIADGSRDGVVGAPLRSGPAPVLYGRYQVLGALGEGGQGSVVAALDLVLGRRVAIKRAKRAGAGAELGAASLEARIAAQIVHPNVLPLLDAGLDEDGHAYLVVPYVSGMTLREAIRAAHRGARGWSVLALVRVLAKVCEALVCAHREGVIHGDLSTGNVLIGTEADGSTPQVFVIDWGLARSGHLDAALRVGAVGTLATLAPELARDPTALSPAADIYAVGALLFHVLRGLPYLDGLSRTEALAQLARLPTPPRAPDLRPGGLSALAEACMAPAPAHRPASMVELQQRIEAFLERSTFEAGVSARLGEAALMIRRWTGLRSGVQHMQGQVRQLRAALPAMPDEAALEPVWALEEELERTAEALVRLEEQVESALRAALVMVPGHARASEQLGQWLRGRHGLAEEDQDAVLAARLEQRLREHDPHGFAAYLRGDGHVEVLLERRCAWRVFAWAPRRRRLEAGPTLAAGGGAAVELRLPMGSYVLEMDVPEAVPVRWPFVVPRCGEVRSLNAAGEPAPVELPGPEERATGEVFVPAGWHSVGGDRQALGPALFEAARIFTPGFFMTAAHVSVGDYLALLDRLAAQGEDTDPWLLTEGRGSGGRPGPAAIARDAEGLHRLLPGADGVTWARDWPVPFVPLGLARAAAAVRARWTGRPYALPTEAQWEKAVRGVDGRSFPWGDHIEVGYAALRDLHPARRGPAPAGAFPVDRSVYGLENAVGSLSCFVEYAPEGPWAAPQPGQAVTRGGHWLASAGQARVCSRGSLSEAARSPGAGLRLARWRRTPDAG